MQKITLKNLQVEVAGHLILENINLEMHRGDVVLILGPNGHGKSTLLKTLMHHYDTKIVGGDIFIDEDNATNWETDEVARAGMYLASQYPVEIPGVSLLELIRTELQHNDQKVSVLKLYQMLNQKMKDLNMSQDLLNRSVNENFSGGERKKNEILQMQVLNPDFILLDEIDSGLDVDAVTLISNALQKERELNKAIIYVSHNDKLLANLVPNKVVLIMNGKIVQIGDYSLAQEVNSLGYDGYAKKHGLVLKTEDSADALLENADMLKDTLKGYSCGGKK